MIYLDNAATTRISPEVMSVILPYLHGEYGNPGALHSMGRSAANAVKIAREQTAGLFHCNPDHVVFTSGATEANNMAIKSACEEMVRRGKSHIVVSALEHDSVLRSVEEYATKFGFGVTQVAPKTGVSISGEDVKTALTPDTGLVSVMYVNNETGAANDIREIGAICREEGVLFHSDCVQAAGQYHISVEEFGIDYAVISAHKIHGPKGVGALYAAERKASPLIYGGAAQEFGLRGGTENVPGIVGLGAACAHAVARLNDDGVRISIRKNHFISSLMARSNAIGLDPAVFSFNANSDKGFGKILSVRVNGVSNGSLVLMLDARGVFVSAGSACTSHEDKPSHVLKAIGLSDEEARSTVRLSFSKYDPMNDIDKAAKIFAECVKTLRSM